MMNTLLKKPRLAAGTLLRAATAAGFAALMSSLPAHASDGGLAGTPLNIGAGVDMTFIAPLRDMDDAEFEVRAFELNIGAPVDPFFDFLATISWHEGEIDLEEAWVSTVLPGGFKLQFGREFIPFGYLNRVHEHDFPQVDQPFVIEGLTTDHGFIGDGFHLEYIAPFLNPTLTLIFGAYDNIQHSVGRRMDGFPLLGRVQTFIESDDGRHAVLAGVSFLTSAGNEDPFEGRLNANGQTTDNRVRGKMDYTFGLDFRYKFSPGRTTYQGLTVGAEFLRVTYDPYENHVDFVPGMSIGADEGFYIFAEWDFDRFRGVGYRFDHTDVLFSSLEDDAQIMAHSIYYQWRPTDFSRLRLQYQFLQDDREDDDEHLVMLQGTFFVGWHPPHRF
jgi:hypothetical protein